MASAAESFRRFIKGRDRDRRVGDFSADRALTKFRTARKKKPKLKDLENHVVVRWAPQWRELGRQLNIEEHQLNIIEHDHPNNCVECCSKMLSDWLEQNTSDHTTWEVLISAIDKLPEGIHTGEDFSTTISDIAESFRTQYTSNNVFTAEDGWFQYQPKHYTALAIVHNKNMPSSMAAVTSLTMNLAVADNIALTPVSHRATVRAMRKETKSISDIFTPTEGSLDNPGITLIEGAPGIGKTALVKKIAIQWANKQLFSSKELLFLVFLREFNASKIISIKDFVQHIVKNNTIAATDSLEKYLCRSKGKSLAIVFDGYDEMSEEYRKKSLVADIIQRKVFHQCCLVITSRPTASSHLHNHVDRRVEIVGFTEEDRFEYIQTALEGKADQVHALQHYLQSNPTINALCYIPLNMTILLCLAEDGVDNLPKTQTDVYEKFIGMTIKRCIQKSDEPKAIKSVVSNTVLPSPGDDVFDVFKELTLLAFKGLQTNKLVFTLAEIKSSCPNLTVDSISSNGLGLLKAIPFFNKQTCNEDVTFRFLHFSVQEYMAAYHISMLPDQKQIKLLQKTFWDHRYYNTWIMYVGITGAASFAFRHFLSGNTMQLLTKLHSNFSICERMLKDKVKCLHLIQCLEESKNEDATSLLRNCLQGQEIDLSDQTLLPSDLNTIGFFLCRSATKTWEAITLSKCNIGDPGCDALCNRFLDKESHGIVRVKRADFSYNQLNLSCLFRLFELFKCWHTSEVIITDDAMLNNTGNNNLFSKIEETFADSHFDDTINLFLLGTFLYAKMLDEIKILDFLSKSTNLKSIYLMHSKWDPNATAVQEWYIALKQQNIESFHVIGMNTSKSFIAALASILSSDHKPFGMFIYDPFLSNSIAAAVVDASSSAQNTSECLRLVISSGGIWGVFNTHSLGRHLSCLELFNLGVCIGCFNHLQVSPWKKSCLQTCSNKYYINEFVMCSFIQHIAFSKSCKCQLQVVLREDNTLFASKADMKDLDGIIDCDDNLLITLCKCDFSLMQYDSVASHCKTLCIVKSHLGDAIIELLCARLFDKQCTLLELFVQDASSVSVIKLDTLMNSQCHSASVLLVANNLMIGHNPTAKQIALAFQLEPSITVWKLPNCRVTADVFYHLTSWLTTVPNNWTELDFEGCNITNTECEFIHQNLKRNSYPFSVKKLAIPVGQLLPSIISKFVEIVITWKVQNLTLYNANPDFHQSLSETIVGSTNIHDKVHLYISSKICKLWFFYNTDLWYEVVMVNNRFSELYLLNCNIPTTKVHAILLHLNKKCNRLSRIFATNTDLPQTVIINLIRNYRNKRVELSLCVDTGITDQNAMNELLSNNNIPYTGLKLVLLTGKCFYGSNVTQQQLRFMNRATHAKYYSAKCHSTEVIRDKELFAAPKHKQLEVVHFVGKEFQVLHASQIATVLNRTTALKVFRVYNYNITDGATNIIERNVILQNNALEDLHFHCNNFEMNNANKIMKALHYLTSIRKLYFSNNYVTDEIVGSLVNLISQDIHLQDIDLSNCGLTESNSLKILSALSKHTNLKVLQMANCNINKGVTELLACILHSNLQLETLDLSRNDLQAADCAVISTELKHTSTLTKLSLSNNSITDEAANDIAAILCDKIQLSELYLSGNCLNDMSVHKISTALKNSSTLKKFYMSSNSISSEAVDDIADILSHNTQLQELELEIINLTENDSLKISNALQYTSMLLKLIIINSNITSESASGIAVVLSRSVLLQELTLDGNFLQGTGIKTIFSQLQNISTLVKLSIQDNHCTEDAAHDLASVISHNIGLQELNLQGNDLQTTGALVVAKALQKLSSLIRLNITNNGICDAVLNDLMAVLLNNFQLQFFSFDRNRFTSKGFATLQDFFIRKRYKYIIYNSRNK